jgi:PAS domain S-box-containing protein
MDRQNSHIKTNEDLESELAELRHQLEEALDTIEAIRSGQIDALVVQTEKGNQLYTLKSADHPYRVFIEKMNEGAITVNTEGIILYCNSSFSRMVKMDISSIIGFPILKFIANESLKVYRRLFERCWKTDCQGEVTLRAGTKTLPVKLSLTTLELELGVSLSIILTDLTNEKRTQKQLEKSNMELAKSNIALEISNHDLQQFASVASHDLQEPLRKIQIFANMMKEQVDGHAPEFKKYLGKIIYSTGRMRNLIVDILNYSRLSVNDPFYEWVDINDLVAELRNDFDLILAEKEAKIISQDLTEIFCNKGQLRQVFQNLISNALKFSSTERKPEIQISSRKVNSKSFKAETNPKGKFVIISIKDNGIGFESKYVESIFSLFERLNPKDKYEGSGLGLAIAKKIIEKHNGLITAIGNNNTGAEFRFILPIEGNF